MGNTWCIRAISKVFQKSDQSLPDSHKSTDEAVTSDPSGQRSSSAEPSCVSQKSDQSLPDPYESTDEAVTSDPWQDGQRITNSPNAAADNSGAISERSFSEKHCKEFKLSSSTVHNIIQRFRESGPISEHRPKGRIIYVFSISGQRSSSAEPSCVSQKSDQSLSDPPIFSDEAVTSDPSGQRSSSAEPSCVSLKSDQSLSDPPIFSDEAVTSDPSGQRSSSAEPSCVSQKSDQSLPDSHKSTDEAVTSDPSGQRYSSAEPSCVSQKSDQSLPDPPIFSDEAVTSDPSGQRSSSAEPSCVFQKSDQSLSDPPIFSDEAVTSDPSGQRSSSAEPSCVFQRSTRSLSDPPIFSDEAVTSDPSGQRSSSAEPSCVSQKSTRSLSDPPKFSDEAVTSDPGVNRGGQTEPQDPSQPLDKVLQRVKDQHKTSMKNKYERLFEGLKLQENEALLNRIYTQLYIIEGEREGVNEEHEVLQMEKRARKKHSQDTPIYCNDIFTVSAEPGREEKQQIKTVLTKGIAGIGKTVSVQKFILDWAEGRANQDVDFMFVFPCRELNLIRDQKYSLRRLLLDFHPELHDLDSKIYGECKVVFIFDGLDESRITLRFSDAQEVSDVTETSSVDVLMSKLMKGEMLPSALIWITSRPAAANQIPSKYINRLTEIQGFNEPQKEEYFRKRIRDEPQASRIISHIRRARSLHIMCHIPVFCWISSTVLQKLLEEDLRAEIPQTLTEMYIHFLLIQINMRNQKYEERDPEKLLPSNREVIVKLAEVAFNQLMKGNVMFYEEDLKESGIDVTDAAVYSGICTEIFKEESVIHQRKVYSFIHLSIQEFLAAFYLFYSHLIENKEPLQIFQYDWRVYNFKVSLFDLLTLAVDKALETKNGQLDLFLRFLLGISLESNQRLLQDLLTHTENSSETIGRTTQYIQKKI
ncbi:NACHT, LRR and PYD domains-containing protein 12-like [Pseudorasbora parva]|uniref:NACHT, LRR and PYD domains-containing protein 12-like n=1 Tax=Pseudorasbora parva TaxID=51549 RepID=UPI00351F54AA